MGEIVRSIVRFGETLERIEGKLDDRPTTQALADMKADQARKDSEQDAATQTLESRLAALMIMALGGALTGAAGLVTAVITRQ